MGTLRRLLLLIAAVAALITGGGGVAAAGFDNRPDVPPPTSGPSFSQADKDGKEDPGGLYSSCTKFFGDRPHTSNETLNGVIDGMLDTTTTTLCAGAAAAMPHPGAIFDAVTKFWDDPIGKFTKAVMDGNTKGFALVMTFWTSVPIPSLSGSAAINGVTNITWELQIIALAFGIGTAAIRVAIARRHAVAEGADEAARMLVRTGFSLWTLPTLVIFLHRVGDSFSIWVLQEAAQGDPNAKVNAIAWINEKTGLGPVVSLVLAAIGLIGSIAQLVALLIREAVLAIAVGLAPIAAASSATGTGRHSWQSIISYTIAALLFKPVASLIYAFAFWAASSDSASDAVVGAVLMAIAGISMPALVRVITPAAASISAGGAQLGGMLGGFGAGAGMGRMGGRGSGSSNAASPASSSSSSGGGGGSPAASGARSPSYGGQYSGNRASAGSAGGSPGGSNSAGRASSGGGASAGGARGAGGTGAGALLGKAAGGTAMAVRFLGRTTASVGQFAEGAIGNYHGQVPR